MFICPGDSLMENIKSKLIRTAGGPKLIHVAKLVNKRFRNFGGLYSLDHEQNLCRNGFVNLYAGIK